MEFRFFEIYREETYVDLLIQGITLSASLTIGAAIFGFLMASLLAMMRISSIKPMVWFSASYIEFVRNTPLIVQLFFVAFGLPLLLNYQWPFWAHALLALILNFSAYFAEIIRAGMVNIQKSQIEGANALGLRRSIILLKIIFPQAIADMYPSLVGQFIFLFLTTGVISEIGVEDLTHAGIFIDSRTFRSFEVFITLTVFYILLSLLFKLFLAKIFPILFPFKCKP